MQKKLMIRFLLFYLVLSLGISTVSYIFGYVFQATDYALQFHLRALVGLKGFFPVLGEILRGLASYLSSTVIPDFQLSSILILPVSAGLLAAAALLFSNGIVSGYGRVCQTVEGLGNGRLERQAAGGVFAELDERLNGLAARLSADADAARGAEIKRQTACDEAIMHLAAAEGRLDVLESAGILREGSTELEMVRDTLATVRKAQDCVHSLANPSDAERTGGASRMAS